MLVTFTNCFHSIDIRLTEKEIDRLGSEGPKTALSSEDFRKVNEFFGGVADISLADWEHIFATRGRTPLAEGIIWSGGLARENTTRQGKHIRP